MWLYIKIFTFKKKNDRNPKTTKTTKKVKKVQYSV